MTEGRLPTTMPAVPPRQQCWPKSCLAETLKERLSSAPVRPGFGSSKLPCISQGQTHRALDAATVTVDEQLQPQLGPPAGPRRFGGEQSDPEFCPPELALDTAVELPAEIEAATAILQRAGSGRRSAAGRRLPVRRAPLPVVDRRVAVEATATARASRRRSRRWRGRCWIAAWAKATAPLADCEGLIEALDELLRQFTDESPRSTRETPARGSGVDFLAETPPQGSAVAAPPTRDWPGRREDLPFERLGHFQIVQRIGSGGMGDVYKGYDASLDRYVAIKVLPAVLARDEDFVRRFQVEATAVAKLAHPNVVPIHFIGQDAGHHFFAMQFIEGESLGQRLARQRRLPLEQAVAIVEQCLAGLEAAHAQGLVHRDVKPGNVLLDANASRPARPCWSILASCVKSGQTRR